MLDNATNNDTLVDGVERRCNAKNIRFSASLARLRCFPHTTHLAAIKASDHLYGALSSINIVADSYLKQLGLLQARNASLQIAGTSRKTLLSRFGVNVTMKLLSKRTLPKQQRN